MTHKHSRPLTKKTSPPPIVFILVFLVLLGGVHWFVTHQKTDSPVETSGSGSIQERISHGGKILVTAEATPEKRAGVQAFASGDYATAIAQFQASLQKYRNDPETLIYLNNAKVGNRRAFKIAVSVPIGSNLNVALEILRGVAQAQDEVNRTAGINKVPLLVEIANDQNDAEIARRVAAEFVKDSQILAVVGHNASSASLAAAPVYQQGELVTIAPTSFAQELTGFGDYIFRALPSMRFVADTLARHIVKHDRKTKIAVCVDAKAPENQSFRNEFISAIFESGGKVVNTVCDLGAPNLNPNTVVAGAVSDGADALLLAPHVDRLDPALAVARANQGRLTLYGSSSLYAFKTLQVGQGDVKGLVLAVPWHPQTNPGNSFADNASKLWGGAVNWRTAMAYDATQAIIAALKQSNTRDGLQKALRSPGFKGQGAADTIQFLPSGDRIGATVLVQVKPGGSLGYDFVPLRP